ncbi:MAG: hypothetical protein A3I43_01130 [Omnitrophica WOR_2 bacterium RIFCSPLOWO2_02_FULL_50_19]|nr:MAG: hypothetical protein A3I43_01130 [Omnitrophica WOR_2 bacterium RIFCSPLOWO2_02_FULL_50_19]
MGIFPDKIKTAIEICETEIKVVQISVSGSEPAIVACVSEETPSNDVRSASDILHKILKAYSIKPKDAILAIPRQSVTTKTISLPSQDPAEIEEMAGFQAIKQIPYPKEEIVYGVDTIETTAEGYSKIMLVICHREMVERPIAVLKACGINPSGVTLSSFGMLNWYRLDEGLRKVSGAAPVVLIECDRVTTDIVITDKDRVIYTRGLTFGSSEGQGYFEKLNEEILRTLSTFEKESFVLKPTLAVFTGDISGLAAHSDFLERSMGLKAEFIDPFRPFPSGAPERFKSFAAKNSFSSLIGCAAGPDRIDLLPRKMKVAHSARAKKNELLVSISLSMAVLILVSLVIFNKMRQKEESLRVIDGRLRDVAPAAQDIGRMKAVADIVRSQSAQRTEPLLILNEFYRIAPTSINLALYKYEEGKVEIKGTASALSEVFKFVKILDSSSYFQGVEVRYAAKRKVQEAEFVDFEIVCPLSTKVKK